MEMVNRLIQLNSKVSAIPPSLCATTDMDRFAMAIYLVCTAASRLHRTNPLIPHSTLHKLCLTASLFPPKDAGISEGIHGHQSLKTSTIDMRK